MDEEEQTELEEEVEEDEFVSCGFPPFVIL